MFKGYIINWSEPQLLVIPDVLIAAGISVPVLIAGKWAFRNWKLKQPAVLSFPAEWKNVPERNVSLYRRLTDELKEQLHCIPRA